MGGQQNAPRTGRPITKPGRLTHPHKSQMVLDVRPSRNLILRLTLLPCIRVTAIPSGPWPQNLCCSCSSKMNCKLTLATSGHWPQTEGARRRDGTSAVAKTQQCKRTLATSGHWPQKRRSTASRAPGSRDGQWPSEWTLATVRALAAFRSNFVEGVLTWCQ